ncbi:MAG: tetratricopeptide repeat protein [Planctomycetaceae bacterium]
MAGAQNESRCLSDCQLKGYLNTSHQAESQCAVESHIEECNKCESRLRRLIDEQPPVLASTYRNRSAEPSNVAEETPVLHRYECIDLIDQGGFGLVWKMRDLHFNRLVAVKVMKARDVGNDQLRRRFFAEAQICSQLSHPNIVPVHDMGELPDGRGFYAMKLVEGDCLDQSMASNPVPLSERLQLFERVCQAVAFAHEKGVIHRDLKPANIMLGRHGDIQVMDWGLAKVVGADSQTFSPEVCETKRQDSDQTARGAVGTVAYMAPEQAVDGRQATTQSDVYALGIILFEMLTGERFGNSKNSVASATDESTGETGWRHPKELDQRLAALIAGCVDSDPSKRPQSGAEVLKRVVEFRRCVLEEAEEQKIESERQKAVLAEAGKKRRLWIALSIALALGMAGTGVAAYFTNVARQDAETARKNAEETATENQRLADNRTDVIEFLTTNVFGKADPSNEPDRELSFRKVLDLATIDAKEMQSDPEVKAEILIELGRVYFNLGVYPESLELFSHAEGIGKEQLGPTHPLYMTSLDQKGMVLLRTEDFAAAEQTLQKAVDLQTEALGRNHEDTIHSLAKMGDLYSGWGKPLKAIAITKDVLARRTKLFGPKYRFTLVSMNGLALLYDQVGRDQEAVDLLRQAYEIAVEIEGPDHVYTISYANNLALALIDVGGLDEAELIAEDVLEVRQRVLGQEHSNTFASRHTLARIWFGQDRFTDCLSDCDAMLHQYTEPSVRRSVVIYLKAKCLRELGQPNEAITVASSADTLLIGQLGQDNRFSKEIRTFIQDLRKSLPTETPK